MLANKLAINSDEFINKNGRELLGLFRRMAPYLTNSANQAVEESVLKSVV